MEVRYVTSMDQGAESYIFDILGEQQQPVEIKVFTMTWNMGNSEAQGLDKALKREKEAVDLSYDLFVIGLQESTYAEANSVDPVACYSSLASAIATILGPNYYEVKHTIRAQLQLFVFAKIEFKSPTARITNVHQSIENTGFLHIFPNKGGILVSLEVDGTKLAFVSCHLTAHEGVKHCEARNNSIIEILGGVRAGDARFDVSEQFHFVFWMGDMNYRTSYDKVSEPVATKKNIDKKKSRRRSSLKVSEVAVVLEEGADKSSSSTAAADAAAADGGDDDDDDPENGEVAENWSEDMQKTFELIHEEKWVEILQLDELNREIASQRVLNGFTALQPSFPPTFKRTRQLKINRAPSLLLSSAVDSQKHVHGTIQKQWNIKLCKSRRNVEEEEEEVESCPRFYHPKRTPSYTDRILYKTMAAFKDHIEPLFFESCEEALSSDHKPVSAGFKLQLSEGERGILVHRSLVGRTKKTAKGTTNSSSPSRQGKAACTNLTLVFSDLRGHDLEEMDSSIFGGLSDPYIVITSDPPSLLMSGTKILNTPYNPGERSKTIHRSLDPVWKDPLKVTIASADLKGLAANASILLSVWDEDAMSKDDLIGVMNIPFRAIIEKHLNGEQYVFDQHVYSNSEVMGKVSGKVSIGQSKESLVDIYNVLHRQAVRDEYMTLFEAKQEANAVNLGCACSLN